MPSRLQAAALAAPETIELASVPIALLAMDGAAAANGATARAPEWVNIIPLSENAEGRLYARDGREFILDDPAGFVAASNAAIAKTGPQPVDKDHEMQSWWRGGGPALGWAEAYELRSDGVYARTDWLEEGAGLITSKKYRYTSSCLRCEVINVVRDEWGFIDDYDLRLKHLEGFTLTNIPALEVRAMFSQQPQNRQGTKNMDITAMLARVGLPATATREEFCAALEERLSAADQPALDKFVPRVEYDGLKARLADAEARLSKQAEDAAAAERDQLLDQALKAGQVLPASAEFYRRSMLAAGGVEAFREFLATAPKLGGSPALARPASTGASAAETLASLTEQELAACKASNIKPEDFAAAKAARLKSTSSI